jgi:hypothetical protein
MGHHVSVFDLADGLSANAHDATQIRLRQESFLAHGLEASGNSEFIIWLGFHSSAPILQLCSTHMGIARLLSRILRSPTA